MVDNGCFQCFCIELKMMSDILQMILVCKVEEVVQCCVQCLFEVFQVVVVSVLLVCGFVCVLQVVVVNGDLVVIVEVKKVSLFKGVICLDFCLVDIVVSYEFGGVSCLLVLIDVDFFQGVDVYFQQVCEVCMLLVLCKDFVIDVYQVYEVCVLGVDCILLIVVVLDDIQLVMLFELVLLLGMDVLVEVYDIDELECVLQVLVLMIGINNCNLCMFEVLLQIMLGMQQVVLCDCLLVIESGIFGLQDVVLMCDVGIYVFLVGEVFMCVEELGEGLCQLFFVI